MKRFLTALLTAAALLAVLPAALAAEEKPVAERPLESVMVQWDLKPGELSLLSLEDGVWEDEWTCYKDQLTGDALTVYTEFETAFAEGTLVLNQGYWMINGVITDELTFSGEYNEVLRGWWQEISEAALLACEAFVMDHPEYFWIRTAVTAGYSASIQGNTVKATLNAGFLAQPATDTEEERSGFQTQIDGVMEQLLDATEGMTTMNKLLYMDNWLAERNHYNDAAAMDGNYIYADETPWSIVGGLLDDYSPVCEGYAKAFQLFCHEIGVPCLQVADYYHMWTYVKFGGEWYLCDPTWNDPIYVGSGDGDESTREYFMTGSRVDHQPNLDFLVPNLAAEDLDYSCAGGHNYAAAVTNPTCTEDGYTTYTCNVCGDSYVADYVDASHNYVCSVMLPNGVVKGHTDYICAVCGDTYQTPWLDPSAYEGMTLACIGDSITAGVGVSKIGETDYVTLLAEQLGMDYIRLGASGTTLCTDGSRTCNIWQLTEDGLQGADVVTIAMGINDFCAAAEGYYELGDIDSTDSSTIYGAVRMWCEQIEELRKTESLAETQFYFVTLVITSWNNSVTSSRDWDQSKTNIHGYTLRDLCNAILEVAALYDVPVVDLNLTSGMYYISAEENNVAEFGGDGVHPGDGGHAMMADALADALLQNDLRNDHDHVYGSWITTKYPSCRLGEAACVCSVCSNVKVKELAAISEHEYTSVVTAPTCTEQGYTTHTCSCGDSYVDGHVDALGHSFTNYGEEEGLLVAHCDNNCGLVDEKIGAPSWRVENGELKGAEYTTGLVMIALYDGDGRLIAVNFCMQAGEKTVDGKTVYRFAAPVFTEAQLAQAEKILCFNLTERYVPMRDAAKVKKLP